MKRWPLIVLVLALIPVVASGVAAQPKDTLTVALVSHAPTLDPHMHFERVGVLININMFDSLLHRNTKMEYEPSLATSWKALSDTQWEFKLRKGVRFHNGDDMTAEDVKYSFERVLDQTQKSPQYGNIRAIKEVRVVNPETVHIITDKPTREAARLKAGKRLAYADCFAAALAKIKKAKLYTGDPEFKAVEKEVEVIWL